MQMFDPRRPDHLAHSGTFNNNILSMSAGVAGLSEVLTAEVLEDLNRRGESLRERLNALCASSDVDMQFTGLGSMFAMHPTTQPINSLGDLDEVDPRERELFYYYLLEHGIYIAKRGFFSLMLPITGEHCDRLVEIVAQYINWRHSDARSEHRASLA
jgi:glutamate-1-semialdehyde 2,1-aminomutase